MIMSEGNGLFDPSALLGAAKRRFATVEIQDLGKVRVRSLTELERGRIEAGMLDKKGHLSGSRMIDFKSRMIVECVVDHDGNQVFATKDVERIKQQDSKTTNALFDAIQAHVGMSDEDVESIEKN